MSIGHKGLILIAVPLISQLIFLVVLVIARGDQRTAQQWAIHSQEVMAQAELAHRLIVEAQTHMRGYVLTEFPSFIQLYHDSRGKIAQTQEKLLRLVADNEPQAQRVHQQMKMAREFVHWMDENMRLVQNGKVEEVKQRIRSLQGTGFLLQLRKSLEEFFLEERRLDQERLASLQRAIRVQDLVLWLGGGLALVSSVVLVVGFSRAITRRTDVLIENTRRFAEGRELAAKLQGTDELTQIDNMFHRMAEAIRQKDQENEMFVYSVSHDLRSPLVNLQGFSQELNTVVKELRELLEKSALTEMEKTRVRRLLDRDAEEAIQFIQSAVTRLAGIIDALLRLSRVGRVEYRLQQVEVGSAVRRIVESMQDTLNKKQVAVSVGKLPPCWADPGAIDQVFANLISNAVNYLDPNRPGKIEIEVLPEETESPGWWTYVVKDNGIGIPQEFQGKVFVAFQRLHPELAAGEGIGLALVRRVVERHGGRIWVESEPGRGSSFYVSLPANEEALPSNTSLLRGYESVREPMRN